MVTLVPLVVGMAVASVHDVEATFVGTAFAAVAVLCTVASQMATASSQRALGCDSNQLLFHTSPLIALGMLALTPIFDDVNAIRHFRYTPILVRDIAASCALALAVNVTNYLVLGKTSPLTYQVVGHLKSVLTILFGFFVLGTETNARNVAGTAIAMGGLVAYTEVKRRMGLGR
jgi:solute carrier family 35 protein E3